jgi:hypothetical protein
LIGWSWKAFGGANESSRPHCTSRTRWRGALIRMDEYGVGMGGIDQVFVDRARALVIEIT